MAQGKVGHFKFINVQEITEERKRRHRRRKINSEMLNLPKKPESLEELLKLLGLEVSSMRFFRHCNHVLQFLLIFYSI